jgi:hypothetical protein
MVAASFPPDSHQFLNSFVIATLPDLTNEANQRLKCEQSFDLSFISCLFKNVIFRETSRIFA